MKNIILILAIATSFMLVLGIGSCSSDAPNPNLAFVGTYNVVGVCNGSNATASFTISATSGSATGIVFNFPTLGNLNATTSGTSFNIPAQSFTDNTGAVWTYTGGGTVTGNNLVLSYQAQSSNNTSNCAWTGSK